VSTATDSTPAPRAELSGKRGVVADAVVLSAVLLVGAALRFWNINTGLPYRVGPDEPVIAERAIQIMRTGDFNPRFFDYPGLYIYLQLLVASVVYIRGAFEGTWRSVSQFQPEHLFAWTRLLNAAIGTLTIPLVYMAAKRWGRGVALWAPLLFALSPNHIGSSHFALTDVPVTFFVAATLVASLRAVESGRAIWFAAAGAGVGLAAATKYNGAYALMLPVIAAGFTRVRFPLRVSYAAAAILVSIFTFLAAAPYTVLDLPAFLNAFGALSQYYRPRPFVEGGAIYAGHMRVAMGWTGFLLVAAGFILVTVRAWQRRDWAKWAVLVVFPLFYFHSVATKQLIFARYLLPMLPFVFISMAVSLVEIVRWLCRLNQPNWIRRLATGAVCGIAMFPLVRAGTAWPREYGRRTTHDIAYDRIQEVIPAGSGVVIERSVLRLPRPYKILNVQWLGARTPEEYISRQMTFAVASSDAFGPVMANPSENAHEYELYQRILGQPDHCLPPIEPTESVSGPKIIICRLDAPIQ
jgi:4-amino-4-deoxy-L-arabinose transferase-like glycosyltransferase